MATQEFYRLAEPPTRINDRFVWLVDLTFDIVPTTPSRELILVTLQDTENPEEAALPDLITHEDVDFKLIYLDHSSTTHFTLYSHATANRECNTSR